MIIFALYDEVNTGKSFNKICLVAVNFRSPRPSPSLYGIFVLGLVDNVVRDWVLAAYLSYGCKAPHGFSIPNKWD